MAEQAAKARILIIDDDELMREFMCDMLQEAGYEVVEARDGAMGIRKQKANPCDLVITDIIMPEKEGLETIVELKRDDPQLRIIAVSGGASAQKFDFLSVAKEFGADRILQKPFKNIELLEAVKTLLGERRPGAAHTRETARAREPPGAL